MKKLIFAWCLFLPACAMFGNQGDKWSSAQQHYYQSETKCLGMFNHKKIKTHAGVAQCVSDRSAKELKFAANNPKIIDNYMRDLKKIGTNVDKKRLSITSAKQQRSAKWTAVQKSVIASQQVRNRSRGTQKNTGVPERNQQQDINQQMLDTLNSPLTSNCNGPTPAADCAVR